MVLNTIKETLENIKMYCIPQSWIDNRDRYRRQIR